MKNKERLEKLDEGKAFVRKNKALAANRHCSDSSGSHRMKVELDRLGKVQISRIEKVEYGSRAESIRIDIDAAHELYAELGTFLSENREQTH